MVRDMSDLFSVCVSWWSFISILPLSDRTLFYRYLIMRFRVTSLSTSSSFFILLKVRLFERHHYTFRNYIHFFTTQLVFPSTNRHLLLPTHFPLSDFSWNYPKERDVLRRGTGRLNLKTTITGPRCTSDLSSFFDSVDSFRRTTCLLNLRIKD